jgi:hypothetical protein
MTYDAEETGQKGLALAGVHRCVSILYTCHVNLIFFVFNYYFKTLMPLMLLQLILKLEIDERIISSPRIPFDVAVDFLDKTQQ